jgi:hypothetical protein
LGPPLLLMGLHSTMGTESGLAHLGYRSS